MKPTILTLTLLFSSLAFAGESIETASHSCLTITPHASPVIGPAEKAINSRQKVINSSSTAANGCPSGWAMVQGVCLPE